MLRKKGHEVARDSQHPRGTAVDFRVAGVPTKLLLRFVQSLHLGGVGYYPESQVRARRRGAASASGAVAKSAFDSRTAAPGAKHERPLTHLD